MSAGFAAVVCVPNRKQYAVVVSRHARDRSALCPLNLACVSFGWKLPLSECLPFFALAFLEFVHRRDDAQCRAGLRPALPGSSSYKPILIHRFPLSLGLLIFHNHRSLPVPICGYQPSLLYLTLPPLYPLPFPSSPHFPSSFLSTPPIICPSALYPAIEALLPATTPMTQC